MKITKIEISNFKSFDNLSIHLNDFNLLVGANASGKSNLVQAFQFLRDIVNHGLENAISLQGGVEYLRNIKIAQSQPFSFRVVMQGESEGFWPGRHRESRSFKIYKIDYKFSLKFYENESGYAVDQDKMTVSCSTEDGARLEIPGVKPEPMPGSKKFSIKFSNLDGTLKIVSNNPDMDMEPPLLDDAPIFRNTPYDEKALLIESPIAGLYLQSALDGFRNIGIYDFDPKLSKKPVPLTGLSVLAPDGSNLTVVLNKIMRIKEYRRRFLNLLRDLLPFIHDVNVEKAMDKSIFFRLHEKYAKKEGLPASLISDGTVNIIALIIALYFQLELVVIIEEPERNVHPYLISRVMDMFREVSKNRQILATTHNPEMVKHADLKNLLLITRDDEGFSRITKPADSDEIKIFLKNDIGIDDLFVHNLLEV